MTKQVDVGLFFGESFYEVIFIERPSDTILFSSSFFNLKDPFKTKLPKIIQNLTTESNTELKIETVFVSYRYLERIFKFKLGGSVAQVVTKGYENWLSLHQHNKLESLFTLKSPPDLSSLDMVFSINEKVNLDGTIEKALTDSEITDLVTDLKKKEAKRVCLSLVNSQKNPAHRNKIKQALEENQFEVFDALELSAENDVPSWRTSLIEASVAGTFNEMKSEITETLQPFTSLENIRFVANKNSHQTSRNILSGLFALEDSFFEFAKTKFRLPDQFEVLHLGLENFSVWLNEDDYWQSPWGQTSIKTKKRIDLKVQPTNSFHLSSFEEVEISANEESFEPGPMCLGRGKIPCIYDVLNCDQVTVELQKKIKDSFWALARSSNTRHSAEKTFEEFRQIIWRRILLEASFLIRGETVVIYGVLPASFEVRAKEAFKTKNLIFISQKDFPKSKLALLRGRAGNI
jgi:N-methylhydantoinase A